MSASVHFGVDELIADVPRALRAPSRVGMVTSNVATTSTEHCSRSAAQSAGVNLVRLFGPEHGLAGTAADGASVDDAIDSITGLPVVSLYGRSVRPSPESLRDLDAILYDIPDVGARFHTYIWTLSHVMEACAAAHKPLYVLDRPNPIGGDLSAVEGPGLDEAHLSSFVGRWNIPIRYSLTIGELARLWNAERKIGCDLTVIRCTGWRRDMHWPRTGLIFVPPSPNLPSYECALIYPGACLIEGTKLSEGRGTESPFRLIGAPWVDGEALAEKLSARALPGVRIKSAVFIPQGRKYIGEACGGVLIEPLEPRVIRPVALGLYLLADLIALHPGQFEWLPYPTAADQTGLGHFDRLIGQCGIRQTLDQSGSSGDLDRNVPEWTRADEWASRAGSFLMYE